MAMRSGVILCLMMCLVGMSDAALAKKKSTPPKKCEQENLTCIRVKKNQSWQSLFPDSAERGLVMRINGINRSVYPGEWLLVPKNKDDADLNSYSPMDSMIESSGEKEIIFDPNKHAWAAYDEDGQLVKWGPATGGGHWCPDIGESCRTKSGTFRIYSAGSSACVSSKFPIPDGGAPMPYCMFFHGGQAFHGSPGGVFQGNGSHGCVRLFVDDAEWLRYEFIESPLASNEYRGTKVVVLPYE